MLFERMGNISGDVGSPAYSHGSPSGANEGFKGSSGLVTLSGVLELV
jgi:hypothetical protein